MIMTIKRRWRVALLAAWLGGVSAMATAASELVLVAEDDWYPYSAEQDGEPVGMAVDIVRAAYEAVGVPVRIKSMPYARCMKLVELGREVGCFNALQDSSTRGIYQFGRYALFGARQAIYARTPLRRPVTLDDLTGKRVGVTNGYTYGSDVEQNLRMQKERADTDLSSLRKLALGRLDYALVFTLAANHLLKTHADTLGGRVYQVGEVTDNLLYVGFSRRHPDAAEAMQQLDRGLTLIQTDGRYQQIVNGWLDGR